MSIYEMSTNNEWYPYFKVKGSTMIIFARFICATILHVSLVDEVYEGLEIMKFACNHPYKFHSYFLAYLAGFL